MGLIFAGTPDFAATALEALLAHGYDVRAVYTQPDRPAGRGQRSTASPVKQLALAHGLVVRQPRRLTGAEACRELAAFSPDAMIVAAYGLLLPPAILATPRLGCINVHASLLPRWRGAAPVQHAILAGDRETGISIMQMDAGLDTGPVLMRAACPIHDEDTAGSLHDRLAALGATTLVRALEALADGCLHPEPQDESRATYAGRIAKEDALIDWSCSATTLERRVRAFNPWPVAYTFLPPPAEGARERLRIWAARVLPDTADAIPGTVVASGPEGIDVAAGSGGLRILRLQAAGRRAMDSHAYLNAHPLPTGTVLGGAPATVRI